MAVRLQAAACSDKGYKRQNNEDNFCINGKYMDLKESEHGALYICEASPCALFAVCDGMGGEDAGEEASLLSCKLCAEYLKRKKEFVQRSRIEAFLRDACEKVFNQAKQKSNRSGSTVAILFAARDGLRVANMGDSRIYLYRDGELFQLSQDHTQMQYLLEMGKIRREEIKTHPQRHVIRQYWGMPVGLATFSPYVSEQIAYKKGDVYLLCSDGLTDMLSDVEIVGVLARSESVEKISRMLVAEALSKGGVDNTTAVVVRVKEDTTRKRGRAVALLCALLALVGVAVFALSQLQRFDGVMDVILNKIRSAFEQFGMM